MATSTNLIEGTTATIVAAGTAVNAVDAIPDNCVGLALINTDEDNTLLIGTEAAKTGDALDPDKSWQVPPGRDVSIGFGIASDRVGLDDVLFYDSIPAAIGKISIGYLMFWRDKGGS